MKYYVFLFLFISIATWAQTLPEKAEDISPLLIGEKLPSVTLKTIDDKAINTISLFQGKKTILIFYRGGWCPYCSRHLSELVKIEKDLLALGYQIIAISPDAPDNLKESITKQNIAYQLYSDASGIFSRSVGLAFKAPAHYEKITRDNQGENADLFLPVPALFIIDENADIQFEYINPNFKFRINGELLMAAARIYSKKPN
jgi:peroxiredoxin